MAEKGNGNDRGDLLAGLDERQRAAALAVDGPVRIIAVAGAGKTRTITRRIAHACASGAWDPRRTLAVTFSVKAANEMRRRIAQLGVTGVRAATFHSAALGQLRAVWPLLSDAWFPQLVTDGRGLVARVATRMGGRLAGIEASGVRDVLEEINWTKVSLIAPDDYPRVCAATHRLPPMGLSPARFAEVIDAYEGEKASRGVIDFNDILLLTCHVLDEGGDAAKRIRSTVGWLTVDEYQDVSPLQHRLMRLWMGQGRDVCVVGDPAQTIYSFAGATQWYLRDFDRDFGPVSADLRLDTDYRSTPQIVRAANHVLAKAPRDCGYLPLLPARAEGPVVGVRAHATDADEAADVASRIARLVASGVRPADIAVLGRLRAQASPVCAALAKVGVPFSVRTAAQEGVASAVGPSEAAIDANARQMEETEDEASPADGSPVARASRQDERRLLEQGLPGHVTVSTIHAAKGLEWRHVFVIGACEGLIPYGSPDSGPELEEERRLMYVAITRGEDSVQISYAAGKDGASRMPRQPSRFLAGFPRRR